MSELLSRVAKSCLFTKGVAARHNEAQKIGEPYTVPYHESRRLAAKLILEEALETINALGFYVTVVEDRKEITPYDPKIDGGIIDLQEIIDGVCDLVYVATGALMACGVPDLPHLEEVCRANEAKFPGGRAIIRESDGKYLKPEGWEAPDHKMIEMHLVHPTSPNYTEFNLAWTATHYVTAGGVQI